MNRSETIFEMEIDSDLCFCSLLADETVCKGEERVVERRRCFCSLGKQSPAQIEVLFTIERYREEG